jgi:hypothetical protein
MATDEQRDRTDDPTSFEVDRHVDDQPPREDLIDPEDIELGGDEEGLDPDELDVPARTGDPDRLPDSDQLPESQGADIVDSERLAEDHADRPPLHDEVPLDDEI